MLPSDRLADSGSGECPLCGYPMDGYMCRLACPNCGYKEDCSDTFTSGPMEAPKDEQEPWPKTAEGRNGRQGDKEKRRHGATTEGEKR